MYKVFASLNTATQELHQYIRDTVYSFIPANGYVFLDFWADALNINNYGYFIDDSYLGKINNVKARFFLAKTQTLDGLYTYLSAVGYPMSTDYELVANTFPLYFPHRFQVASISASGIAIVKGTTYAGTTYPNSVFETEEEAKNTLIVVFPSNIDPNIVPKFKYCLEEVLNLAIKIIYINDDSIGLPFGYIEVGNSFDGIIGGFSDEFGSSSGGEFIQ